MTSPAGLDEHTAKCERCGCSWFKACPGGCAWNPRFWRQGKAICTACVPLFGRTKAKAKTQG